VAIACALAMLLEETRKGLVRRWGRSGRCSGEGIARGKSPWIRWECQGLLIGTAYLSLLANLLKYKENLLEKYRRYRQG
jgi:hypothetical protein